jgi:hypothetical protein
MALQLWRHDFVLLTALGIGNLVFIAGNSGKSLMTGR